MSATQKGKKKWRNCVLKIRLPSLFEVSFLRLKQEGGENTKITCEKAQGSLIFSAFVFWVKSILMWVNLDELG